MSTVLISVPWLRSRGCTAYVHVACMRLFGVGAHSVAWLLANVGGIGNSHDPHVQAQVNITGDAQGMERARAIARFGGDAGGSGLLATARDQPERELFLFFAFQNSREGAAQQAILTEKSKRLADYVGGHQAGEGTQIATVYHRIMRKVAPYPGKWLLQRPLSGHRLAQLPQVARELTQAVVAANGAKDKWLRSTLQVVGVDKVGLRTEQGKAALAAPCATVEDVEIDFPHGPFGEHDDMDGDDAVDDGDVAMEGCDDSHADVSDHPDEIADAELQEVMGGVTELAALGTATEETVYDAVEEELRREAGLRRATEQPSVATDSGVAVADADPGMSAEVPAPAVEAASGEPGGATAHFTTASGETMYLHLSHQASLGVLSTRQYQVHLLTIHPDTGESVIPYPPGMRVPKGDPVFETDYLTKWAHSSGEQLMQEVRAVLHGSLPVVPARFANMSPAVRRALTASKMCIVQGCPSYATAETTNHSLHLCEPHQGDDIRVMNTEEDVRLCTACHGLRAVEEFREGQGSETTGGVCHRCLVIRRNRAITKKNARQGTSVPTLPVPEHKPPSATEIENGKDCTQAYILERRAAAQCAAPIGTRPGETLSDPILVLATYAVERRGHEHQCVRVGCLNDSKSSKPATLCRACCKVRGD